MVGCVIYPARIGLGTELPALVGFLDWRVSEEEEERVGGGEVVVDACGVHTDSRASLESAATSFSTLHGQSR